jgi:Protein of unknown function (DUF1569)
MRTFWDAATRDALCRRIEHLTPESAPRWGKFSAAQMVAHLNDAMRMAAGDLPVASKNAPFRFFPLKQLIIYALPFPKGAPTAPELLARGHQATLGNEQVEFRKVAERLASKLASEQWPDHPAFGALSHKDWGALMCKHTEHHLKQFGV